MSGPAGRVTAGLQPLGYGPVGIAGPCQVVRQQFGLALDKIGEMRFQRRSRTGVQFLPPRAQQGAVRGVLHQRVLELVGRVRRCAARKQQAGLSQPR